MTERFQFRSKFLQSSIQCLLVPAGKVDKFQPFRFDFDLFQPAFGVTNPLAGTHRPFQVLAGLLRACKDENSFSTRGHCLEQVVSFDLPGAGDGDKAEAGPRSGKVLLISVLKEPEIMAIVHNYFCGLCFHFLLGGTSVCSGRNFLLCHFSALTFKLFLSRLMNIPMPAEMLLCPCAGFPACLLLNLAHGRLESLPHMT